MSGMRYEEPGAGWDEASGDRTIRILIVDDHALYRVGVRNILGQEEDFEVVGEAEDGRTAFDLAVELSPDIVLMDLSLPAPGGNDATQKIKRELPATGIIVLSPSEDEEDLFAAIRSGAAAFILKDVAPEDLVEIIRRVADGEFLINDKVFSKPAVASRVLKEFRELAVYGQEAQPIFAPLSPKRRQRRRSVSVGRPSSVASQPSIGWMQKRFPARLPPMSSGSASGEPLFLPDGMTLDQYEETIIQELLPFGWLVVA